MIIDRGKFAALATLAVFMLCVSGFAQLPCGVANQIYCQPWDGSGNLYASQNDTNGGGNFATVYDNFTLTQTWDVESFHWVGGYFNPPVQGQITGWTLTFYNDAAGQPGNAIATGFFPGNGGETFITDATGFPTYVYWLFFNSFDMGPGTYWASVVPDLGFPPQWGWATSAGGGDGHGWQCFSGACGDTGVDFAFALDGHAVNTVPEPSTLVMLGTSILGLAGTFRRKLL